MVTYQQAGNPPRNNVRLGPLLCLPLPTRDQ